MGCTRSFHDGLEVDGLETGTTGSGVLSRFLVLSTAAVKSATSPSARKIGFDLSTVFVGRSLKPSLIS